jgi:hypothetical protein
MVQVIESFLLTWRIKYRVTKVCLKFEKRENRKIFEFQNR